MTGKDVKDRSLTYRDLKRNTLGGSRVKESRLGVVPRANNSRRVGGFSAARLLLKCQSGMIAAAGTCIETTSRNPAPYGVAVNTCAFANERRTPGRRLPTHGELTAP